MSGRLAITFSPSFDSSWEWILQPPQAAGNLMNPDRDPYLAVPADLYGLEECVGLLETLGRREVPSRPEMLKLTRSICWLVQSGAPSDSEAVETALVGLRRESGDHVLLVTMMAQAVIAVRDGRYGDAIQYAQEA